MKLPLSELNLLIVLLSAAIALIFILSYKIILLKNERNRILNENQKDSKILFLKSRYASMGETVGNIAHQWKQPLNAIGAIQNSIKAALIYQGEISKEKLLNSVETSFKLLQHLAETIDTFYNFLSQRNSENTTFLVSNELEAIRKITEYSFQNSRIKLEFILDTNPMIQGSANEFTHAMLNLILNAKEAFDQKSINVPTITVHVSGEENICSIQVFDNAGGIRVEPINMVFDLHISTKDEGSGLGLFMTKNIIENRFGGTISVENKNGGACFTLTLPYAQYGEHFSLTETSNEKLTLERINQLSRKVIELEEVEKTLKKWADIFKQAHWGIAMHVAKSNTFEMTNTAFHTLYGYTAQELNILSVPDLFTPESLPLLPKVQQEAFEKGYVTFETVHKRKDGSTFPVSIELIVVKDDEGEILYQITNMWDLTEKKASEENLLLKNFALNTINEAVYLIDKDSMFHYVNEGACAALGYTEEELLTMGVIHIDPNATREWWNERWGKRWTALNEQKNVLLESSHRRKDGTVFPVEISINHFEYNGIGYNLAISRDITERLLLEEEKKTQAIKSIAENIPDNIARWDIEGRYLYINPVHEQTLGMSADQVIGTRIPEEFAAVKEAIAHVLKTGEAVLVHQEVPTKDGAIAYHDVNMVPERDASGKIVSVLGVGRDMTHIYRLQNELAQREKDLRLMADSSPGMMGTFHMRSDGSVYMPYVSPNLIDIFGLQPQEVKGNASSLLALTHPDDAQRVLDSIGESAKNMSVWHEEYRILHPTKGERWMESNTMPQLHPEGGIVWYGYVHDVTERKLTEMKLEDSHNFLNLLINSIHDPIFVKDREHRWIILNDANIALTGFPRETLIGKSDHDIFPKEQADIFWEKDEAVFNSGIININEEYFTSSDGIVHCIETIKSMFTANNGKEYLVGTIRDISERKKSEEMIKELNATLEKKVKERTLQLQKSLELNEGVINAIPDLLFEMDINGTYLNVWAQNQELLVDQKEILLNRTVYDVLSKEAADTVIEALKEAYEKNSSFGKIIKINLAQSVSYFELSVSKKASDDTFLVLSRDVTERIEAVEALHILNTTLEEQIANRTAELQKALELNEGIINALPDLLFEIAPDGTYIGVWAQNKELLAAQKEILLGNNFKNILPPNAVIISLQALKEVDEKGYSLGKTYTLDLPEGNRWFELSVTKKKSNGNYIVLSRDITQRMAAEEALQSNRNLLYAILESSPGVITFALDKNYRYIAFDSKHAHVMRSIFGIEISIGMNLLEAVTANRDREIAKQNFDRALRGESFTAEDEYGDERLSHKYWQIFYSPIHSETGEVIGLTCFNIDITQRRLAEEKIQNLNTTLEKRVFDRTAQLEEAIMKLHKEIEKRKEREKALLKRDDQH